MIHVNKTAIIIVTILVAALLATGIAILFLKPLYYRFVYSGDRITGTVHVTVDGEPYELEAGDFSALYQDQEINAGFSSGADGAKLSIHGGEYGPYRVMIEIDGVPSPLEAVVYQYNWWNAAEFDLDISVDRAAETITFSSTAQVLNENGELHTQKHSTTAEFSDRNYIHSIVSV